MVTMNTLSAAVCLWNVVIVFGSIFCNPDIAERTLQGSKDEGSQGTGSNDTGALLSS
jgi:hypothetical protein